MVKINDYFLFLFDLDGLLVDTEHLHYLAYKKMTQDRGFTLQWDFPTYFKVAERDAGALRDEIYKAFPDLYQQEPNWDVLYEEKKNAFIEILKKDPVPLMTGAKALIDLLAKKKAMMTVVTHSSRELVTIIRQKNKVLDQIEHWFCREDYQNPKPSPDGYKKAIDTLCPESKACIGFEDSYRGMQSLLQTRAEPIFVNKNSDRRKQFKEQGIQTFETLDQFLLQISI